MSKKIQQVNRLIKINQLTIEASFGYFSFNSSYPGKLEYAVLSVFHPLFLEQNL